MTDIGTYNYFVDGEWRSAGNGQTFDDVEPYAGSVYAKVAAGGREEARHAVAALAAAFPAWAATTPAERARLLLKAAEIVKRRRASLLGYSL